MKNLFVTLFFCLSSLMSMATSKAYLFSYFVGNSTDGLHLAYSYDGLNWKPLRGGASFLTPIIGKDKLMRDPSICQGPDGTFHMVWTSSWTDRIIGYASSRDLVNWSEQRAIPVMMHEPQAHNCWAPELFYDEASRTFYIFWATTIPGRHKEVPTSPSEKGLNHRIYYVTTKDFQTFSDTGMFFNPDFSVIDAAIVKDPKHKDLIMVLKNENSNPPEKNLRVTRVKKLSQGFPTQVSAPITGKYWAEGPAPLFVGDTLYVYFDKYRDHRYGAVRSLDHGQTWEDISDKVSFPQGIRHGTAFQVDASVVEGLKRNAWFADRDLTVTGAYYYPEHWDESQWERDFRKMREMGFEFTHFAEFAWAQLEPEEGRYDFSWLDRAVELAAKYDLKVIMCTSTATPPVWLSRKYPEILLKNEDGTVLDHGARQHASFSSPLYRKLSYRMIEQLAKHYGNDPRIIGWQLDNEPAVQFDYNAAAQQGFRDFLRKKYTGNIRLLNEAWGTSFWSEVYASFDEITLPKRAQMFMNHHQILDYRRFAASQTNEFLDEQCKLIKKYAVNQWVTTNYIPNYEEGHIGGSPSMDFQSYTRYMVYGDNEGIGRRGYRVGNPLRIAWANDFFRPIQGSYGVMELQPGQVNWGSINPQPLPGAVRLWLWSVFAGGSDFICTYRFRQPLYGTEQYHYGIVGTDGVTVTPGGREFATFMEEIRALRSLSAPREHKPADYKARRTAILFNHENSWSIERQKQNHTWNTLGHIEKYYRALKSFGAPVDFISESKNFSDYPVVIAPAYQMADSALVNRWIAYVKQGGNLVLTCRTAQKDRYGRLPEIPFGAMLAPLTGNALDFYDLLLPENPGKMVMKDKTYTWNTWGEVLKPASDAQVWATYTDEFYEGAPAVTFRRLGQGTITYVGVDSREGDFEKDLLKRLYAEWNIPVMDLPYGVTLEYRNGLGIVLNYGDSPYTFSLPKGAQVLIGTPKIPTAGVLVFRL